MSTAATTDVRELPPGSTDAANNLVKIRIWPAVVLTVAFWVFLYANHEMESAQTPRFVSRMIAYLVALIGFFGWWLSRSQIRWRDRLLAIAVPIAFGAITLPFVDKSTNWFGLLLNSLPIVMTVWTAWLVIARSFTARAQRLGFCAVMLLPFIYGLLLRFDGLRAQQSADMSWRWMPTDERRFLASHEAGAKDAAKPGLSVKGWALQPGDCPEFRGPNRDGILTGVSIVADWNEHPPKLLWKKRVGPGWSGMIVVDGHVVTQEQRDAVEAVVCYNAATGDELWAHNDAKRFEESLAGAGPRGTPTFASDRIYSLGGLGTLNCLKPETGEVIWSHDVIKDAAVAVSDLPIWGFSVSPLVVDGLVIVFAGGTSDKSILAYRVDDGTFAWTAPGGKQSYSSPQLATLNGQKQIVMHDTGGTRALNVTDGKEVWSHPNADAMSLPMLQPHVVEPAGLVVSTAPGMVRYEVNSGRSNTEAAPVWESSRLKPDFSDFVIHKGCIYGLNDGILCRLDLETGNQVWKKSRLGHGQMLLLADQDALLVSNEKGEIILVSVNREGPTELGRFQAIEGKTWNGPVLVGNRLFLRNAAEMAAYEVNIQKSPSRIPASAQPINSL